MLHRPSATGRHDQNILVSLATRQRNGTLGFHSPHIEGAILNELVWSLEVQEDHLEGHDGCVNALRWDAHGQHLVSGSDDCKLNVWDSTGRLLERVRTRHTANIFDAHFKPNDENVLISCAADGAVFLTPRAERTCVPKPVWNAGSAMALKISLRPQDPDVLIASFGDGSLRQFDLRQKAPLVARVPVVPQRTRAIVVAEFSPCGNLIAAGAADTVRIFDIRWRRDSLGSSHANSVKLEPPEDKGVSSVCWSPCGRMLLANFMGGDIILFDSTLARRHLLNKRPLENASPSSDTNQSTEVEPRTPDYVSSRLDRSSDFLRDYLRDADKEVELDEIKVVTDEESVLRSFPGRMNRRTFAKEVRFCFGDNYVVSGGDCGNLFIWRTRDAELIQRIPVDSCICNSVAPHPTLPLLAASGIDDTVKLIQVGSSVDRLSGGFRQKSSTGDYGATGRQKRELSAFAAERRLSTPPVSERSDVCLTEDEASSQQPQQLAATVSVIETDATATPHPWRRRRTALGCGFAAVAVLYAIAYLVRASQSSNSSSEALPESCQ